MFLLQNGKIPVLSSSCLQYPFTKFHTFCQYQTDFVLINLKNNKIESLESNIALEFINILGLLMIRPKKNDCWFPLTW